MKVPVIDIGDCTFCGGCYDLYPQLFRLNDAGYVEVVDTACYPKEEVDDAVKHCPQDCIHWEEIEPAAEDGNPKEGDDQ